MNFYKRFMRRFRLFLANRRVSSCLAEMQRHYSAGDYATARRWQTSFYDAILRRNSLRSEQ